MMLVRPVSVDRAVQVQPVSPGRRGKRAALSARHPASGGLGLVGRMDGVDVDDRLVRAERVAQVLVRSDELALGFRVDLARHGFRLLPVEADAVHQLDQSGAAIVEPEPLQDELSDLGGRRIYHIRRPGAQFVELDGRQRAGAALQIEQDERLDAAFLEFLEPCPHGGVVEEQRLGDIGIRPASVEQEDGVRPPDDAMLLQPVPDDLHQVDPIRRTEEIAVRLHQASGIDPADSVKRFSKGRGIPLYPCRTLPICAPTPSDSSLLWDGVRVLARLLQAADALVGGLQWRDHRRAAKKRARTIEYARDRLKRTRNYRELLKLTRSTLAYA